MDDSARNWALNNFLRSWSLYNLTEQEMRFLLQTLSEAELRLARICQKNEKTWHSIDKKNRHAFLFEHIEADYNNSEGYPNENDIRQDSITEADYFVIRPSKILRQRLHKRFDVSRPCRILNSNQEFVTETKDVSEGGLSFRDLIPNWVAGYFLVVIDNKFQLMCSLVEDQKEKKRVQIVSEESDINYSLYKKWLSSL